MYKLDLGKKHNILIRHKCACIHTDIYTSIHLYIYTSIHLYIYTSIYLSIHPYIQTDRQTDRQPGRQTDRQTDRHTYIHTYIHIYIYTYVHNINNAIGSYMMITLVLIFPRPQGPCVCPKSSSWIVRSTSPLHWRRWAAEAAGTMQCWWLVAIGGRHRSDRGTGGLQCSTDTWWSSCSGKSGADMSWIELTVPSGNLT